MSGSGRSDAGSKQDVQLEYAREYETGMELIHPYSVDLYEETSMDGSDNEIVHSRLALIATVLRLEGCAVTGKFGA